MYNKNEVTQYYFFKNFIKVGKINKICKKIIVT